MLQTITVLFDGEVLRPLTPLELTPDTEYVITIDTVVPPSLLANGDAWQLLETLTGTVNAPADWSAEHDHYLYGIPKKQP